MPPGVRPTIPRLPRRGPFRQVPVPPLVPGLPVVWCPTLVVDGLVQIARLTGYAPRPAWGFLDDMVAPWGCQRIQHKRRFLVPCDCGRMTLRLWLAPNAARWGCKRCLGVTVPVAATQAARLLFGLRIGLRGAHLTALHLALARMLLRQMRCSRAQRFHYVQAATVVLSYDPRMAIQTPYRAGPVMRYLESEVVSCWLHGWASPMAYYTRCVDEICARRS